jgi:hypothetical protein
MPILNKKLIVAGMAAKTNQATGDGGVASFVETASDGKMVIAGFLRNFGVVFAYSNHNRD